MNYLDIIIIIPVLVFAFLGFRKGLVVEVATLVALIVGIFAAIYLSSYVSGLLVNQFGMNERYVQVVSFILIFIVVLILVHLLAKLVEKAVNMAALGIVNKLLGSVFSICKIVFILSLLIWVFNKIDINQRIVTREKRDNSLLYKPVGAVAPLIIPKVKEEVDRLKTQQMPVMPKP